MTPDIHREALAALGELWALSPDVRLGQLLAHLGFLGEAHVGRELAYIDDDELLAVMCRHRSELLARTGDASAPPPGAVAMSISGSPRSIAGAHAAKE